MAVSVNATMLRNECNGKSSLSRRLFSLVSTASRRSLYSRFLHRSLSSRNQLALDGYSVWELATEIADLIRMVIGNGSPRDLLKLWDSY